MAVEQPLPVHQGSNKVTAPDITSPPKSVSAPPSVLQPDIVQDPDVEMHRVVAALQDYSLGGDASDSSKVESFAVVCAEQRQDHPEPTAEVAEELLEAPSAAAQAVDGAKVELQDTISSNGAADEGVKRANGAASAKASPAKRSPKGLTVAVSKTGSNSKVGDRTLKQQLSRGASAKSLSATDSGSKPTILQSKAAADESSIPEKAPPLRSPRKPAADQNATPEKLAPKKVRRKPASGPTKPAADKSASQESTPNKATPDKTPLQKAPEGNAAQTPPGKEKGVSPKAAASAHSTPEQGNLERTTPGSAGSVQSTPDKTTPSRSTPGKLAAKSNLRIQSSLKKSVSPRTPKASTKTRLFSPKSNGNSPRGEDEPKADEDTPTKTRRVKFALVEAYLRDGVDALGPDSPNIGPTLLRLAKTYHATGESPLKAQLYAKHAAKYFGNMSDDKYSLDLVLSLHILGALHCRLGQFEEAIPVLERSLTIPDLEQGLDHYLALFAGHMQLGDTYALMGNHEQALQEYHKALEVQKQSLGDSDPRFAETCRYVAEAHVQAMQFDEAETLCHEVLRIHGSHSPPGTVEQAADRRLMALIYSGKGDHEKALEHLEMASATLLASGEDSEAASVDVTIGETYLAMGRHEEAVASYQKALSVLKSAKGETDAAVATVYVSLAELHLKTGKFKEAKAHCENALKIYGKSGVGLGQDDIATGLTEVGAIYEAMNEREPALHLLQKALSILETVPGQQSAAAGIQAQMGVMYYVLGHYADALNAFKGAVMKIRAGGDQRKPLLGLLLNQMGLVCVELYEIDDAAEIFEEARTILEEACGPTHSDTLAVCTNLAGTYDAQGRSDEAIRLLEFILQVKEERLGTVHPDLAEERAVLVDLLRAVGRSRRRKSNTLQELLDIAHEESRRFRVDEVVKQIEDTNQPAYKNLHQT